MKDFLEDLREAFAMTIAAIVIPLAAILVVTIVYAVMLRAWVGRLCSLQIPPR